MVTVHLHYTCGTVLLMGNGPAFAFIPSHHEDAVVDANTTDEGHLHSDISGITP